MNENVDDFLAKCRELIDKRKVDLFLNDKDNRNTMEKLGYNPRALMQELKDLCSEDLHKGPEKDKDINYPGEVWIFKKYISNILIYIKLKIRIKSNGEEVFLMSFHEDR